MQRGRLRSALAAGAAAGVAEAAVLLLRPRDGVVQPDPVDATSYFSPDELDRARAYRGRQRWIGRAGFALETGLMAWLLARPPAALIRPRRHPVAASGVAGAALSAGFASATLPIAAVSRTRALRVGLATGTWRAWASDAAKATAIGAGMAGAGAAAGIALMRGDPDRWWLPGSAVAVGASAALATVAPVVLDPIFNRFTPLEGELREDVVELAAQAGVKVGGVFSVDASRRTTAANAYVTGLGATKRVVLFDTLIDAFSRDERRLVIAHELAHVRHRDVQRSLAFLALVAPLGLRAAARMTDALVPSRAGDGRPGPQTLPALAASLSVLAAGAGAASSRLSRRVEFRADLFALRLTALPQAFIDFERRITVQNVAEPDPPGWLHRLMATHPTTLERIGVAEAVKRSGAARATA